MLRKAKKYLPYIQMGAFCILATIGIIEMIRANDYKAMLDSIAGVKHLQKKTRDDYKAEYIDRCLRARQVYQYSWWKGVQTKVGKVYVKKRYAMTLQEYNDLIEKSWRYNRVIGLPLDGPVNYYMLAKWILESAINPHAKHKTGEVLCLTGYTECGMAIALHHYKNTLKIEKGHALYIPGIYDRHPAYERIFSSIENVIKLDYAYIYYLLQEYDYKWDFVLTGFHLGEGKIIYWIRKDLKSIPNYRLDGKWKGYWLRAYYQTVYEIAEGIYQGRLSRISRWQQTVGKFKKVNKIRHEYVQHVRIRMKRSENFEELEKEHKAFREKLKKYKKLNEELIIKQGKLNDIELDYRREKRKEVKAKIKKIRDKARKAVIDAWKRLKREGK